MKRADLVKDAEYAASTQASMFEQWQHSVMRVKVLKTSPVTGRYGSWNRGIEATVLAKPSPALSLAKRSWDAAAANADNVTPAAMERLRQVYHSVLAEECSQYVAKHELELSYRDTDHGSGVLVEFVEGAPYRKQYGVIETRNFKMLWTAYAVERAARAERKAANDKASEEFAAERKAVRTKLVEFIEREPAPFAGLRVSGYGDITLTGSLDAWRTFMVVARRYD